MSVPKVTATVHVTLDWGNGEVTQMEETAHGATAVLPLIHQREYAEAKRMIDQATTNLLARCGGGE